MEENIALAQELLRTIADFLENGSPEDVAAEEMHSYFTMCKQIEIFHEKFRQKGFTMSFDLTTGAFSLTTSTTVSFKYDLSRLADKLFERFCTRSTPMGLLTQAVHVFHEDFGAVRFAQCAQMIAGQKQMFNVESELYRAEEKKYNLEAILFMEAFESVALRPDGLSRVIDLAREFVLEDECAETVVAMFVVDSDDNPRFYCQLKRILLGHLRDKFKRQPHVRLWQRILSAVSLVDAVNANEPFLHFVLDLVKLLSSHIRAVDSKAVSALPNSLTYPALLRVVNKLYRNKQSCQVMINFIFNQFATNQVVWSDVLSSCHRIDAEAVEHSAPLLPFNEK